MVPLSQLQKRMDEGVVYYATRPDYMGKPRGTISVQEVMQIRERFKNAANAAYDSMLADVYGKTAPARRNH